MGVTDAFSLVSNPIQSPICSFNKVIFVTFAIPSTKTKMRPKVVLILYKQLSLATVNSFFIYRGVFGVIDSN